MSAVRETPRTLLSFFSSVCGRAVVDEYGCGRAVVDEYSKGSCGQDPKELCGCARISSLVESDDGDEIS